MTIKVFSYKKGDTFHFILSYDGDAIENRCFNEENGGYSIQEFGEDRSSAIDAIKKEIKAWTGNVIVSEETFSAHGILPKKNDYLFAVKKGTAIGELK